MVLQSLQWGKVVQFFMNAWAWPLWLCSYQSQARKIPMLSQETITFLTMSKAQYDALDEDFAAICYEEGLSFSLFESLAMKWAPSIESLIQTTLATKNRWPPPRQSLFQYERQSSQVFRFPHLIKYYYRWILWLQQGHIANISIHTPIGSIHWLFEDLSLVQSSSVNIEEWLEGHLYALTHGNLEHINSCAIDTCPTILSMWEYLRSKPNLHSTSLSHPRFTWNSTPHPRPYHFHSIVQESPWRCIDDCQSIQECTFTICTPSQYFNTKNIVEPKQLFSQSPQPRDLKKVSLMVYFTAKQPSNVIQYISRICQRMSLTLFCH